MFADRRAYLIIVALLAACDDTTGLRATVRFGPSHRPDRLMVNARVTATGDTIVAGRVLMPSGRKVESGDSFVLLLPDRFDGTRVSVFVDALSTGATLSGSHEETVRKGRVVDFDVQLGEPALDGGADLTPGDGAVPDDGALPDLVSVPDLIPPVDNGGGLDGGGLDGGGLDGGGGGCGDPLALSVGTTMGSITGLADHTTGSCGGSGGSDVVGRFTLTDWRTVTLDTVGSSFDTLLYARRACADPFSELPRHGPCPGAATTPGMACSDDAQGSASRLILCGLPAGAYHAWLDSKPGGAGAYTLSVAHTTVDLNSCAGAGNLLPGGTYTATTVGHADSFFSDKAHSCKTGDRGMGSPDATFFLALDATRDVTLSTAGTSFNHLLYVRPTCAANSDLACTNAGGMTNTVTLPQLAPGLYYVIVDGVAGASGTVTLTVTVK